MRKCLSLVYNLLNCLHFGRLWLSHRRSFGNPPRVSEVRLAIAKNTRGLALRRSSLLSLAPLPPWISCSSRGCLFYGLRYIGRAISQFRRDKMEVPTPQRNVDSPNQQGYQRQPLSYMCAFLPFPVCGDPSCTKAVAESNAKMPVTGI